MRSGRRSGFCAGRIAKTALPVAAAAVLGNAFVGSKSMEWFSELRRPKMQLPMSGFYIVGLAYYAVMGVVVHRSVIQRDRRSYRLALIVLAGNELWNVLLFGRRSPRDAFLGIITFLVPLGLLQASVSGDHSSRTVLAPYTAWVVFYDLPWTYRLWRLNVA
ncbi:MAG: TspO/MBR family protein [Mycobacterium sp.]